MSRHHHANNTVAALAFEDLSRCRSFEEDTTSPQPISDGNSSSRSSSFSSERLQHNPYLVDVLGECGAMHTSPLNLTRSPTKIHSGAASSHEDDYSQYHLQQPQFHQQHQEFPSVPTSRSLSPYDASAASGASFWETPMGSTTTRSPVAHTPAAAFPASPTQSAPTPNTATAKNQKHHHHRVKDPNVAAMAAHWTKYLQQQGIKPCSTTTTSHVCPKVSSRPGAAQHHHMRGCSSSSAPSSPLLPTSSPGISTSVSRVYHNGRPVPVVVPKVVVATTTQ